MGKEKTKWGYSRQRSGVRLKVRLRKWPRESRERYVVWQASQSFSCIALVNPALRACDRQFTRLTKTSCKMFWKKNFNSQKLCSVRLSDLVRVAVFRPVSQRDQCGRSCTRMAGDDDASPNNEILSTDGEGQGASVRGEPHSRVGGILECDPPGNKNSPSERVCNNDDCADGSGETMIADDCNNSGGVETVIAGDNGALCRYALSTVNTAMSFIEVCQVTIYEYRHYVLFNLTYLLVNSVFVFFYSDEFFALFSFAYISFFFFLFKWKLLSYFSEKINTLTKIKFQN